MAIAALKRTFAQHDLDHCRERLTRQDGVREVVQSPREVLEDVQAVANEYLIDAKDPGGVPYRYVANPIQVDEHAAPPSIAPELGQHTEEVLREAGVSQAEIDAARDAG